MRDGWSDSLSASATRTLDKYGAAACLRAWDLHLDDGEGGYHIALELGVHVNSTSSMIAAGEELNDWIFS